MSARGVADTAPRARQFLRSLPDGERQAITACFNAIDEDMSGSLNTAGPLHTPSPLM
jgi:hypothetical protein